MSDATATLHRETRARPLGLVLRILDARATPRSFQLNEGDCTLGAGEGCDVVIEDDTVSRRHASFTLAPEGCRVRDLGSRNGTFYLGQRVDGIVLAPGSVVTLGRVTVAIDPDADSLRAGIHAASDYRGLIGGSVSMRMLFASLERLEASLVPILLEGESGAGKEVVARALHAGSMLADKPLVVINCGAITRELVASELFGHRKGAFTGAAEARKGAFALANGGTLFLDEIGELPLEVQPALLRALESGEIRPVGDDKTLSVHVRVIAATNRDLADEVDEGRFREDLFYRIAVVRLVVPPLRERAADIPELTNAFARSIGCAPPPPEVMAQLIAHRWPGNVRELRNAVQAYAALGALPPLRAREDAMEQAVSALVDPQRPYLAQKNELNDRFARKYLEALMSHTGGNQTKAAQIAGLDRTYLNRLLAKYRSPRE